MIMLYDRLYCTDNYRELSVRDYLQPLTEEVLGSFPGRSGIRIETDIEDFILNIQMLTPLGIIVNELLTNIMKHAFTGRDRGVVGVALFRKDIRMYIHIKDDGVGIPETVDFGKQQGFGLDLVNMLVDQIGGSVRIERGEGTKFVLEFDIV
jgi:two-component sensor histidine kinase